MKVLGIIPARGGSKRVPGKNVKMLGGKPLIAHTIETAKASLLINDFIVTTDDPKIVEVAKTFGAKAPFIRPSELANDKTGDRPVLIHALKWYMSNIADDIHAICILRPTSPFRTSEMIDNGIEKMIESASDSVRSMTKVEGVHHPYWMFKKGENGFEAAVDGISIEKFYQSQLLPPIYRLNGMVDIISVLSLLDETSPLYGKHMEILETAEELSHDIDTIKDFQYCEWLMSNSNHI
ncbi:MAG: acylneuraminate cytidylyltransferase family protein [Crocinitomicaceae bacterium]